MVKKLLSVGVMLLLVSLLVVGCGVPQEEYDAVVANREAAEVEAASLQSQLSIVESDLAKDESNLSVARSELAAVQSDLEAVESELATVQSDLATAQSNLATAQSDLATVQSDLATAQSNLAAAESYLAATQTEMDALETRMLAFYATLPTTSVKVINNIEYGKVERTSLRLDMYIPETPITTPMPAIIWIHGGYWKFLDKSSGSSNARYLATHGFLTVSINYRLSGVAPFPAAVEDCKYAVRWLRANAEKYNVDPDRIGVWGGSAGGHLVMMVGSADETAGLEGNSGWAEYSSGVQAVCSYYGLGDLVSPYEEWGWESSGAIAEFLAGTYQEKPEIYEAASPIYYVTADDPPLLLIHGELDKIVPIIQSEVMYEAYQEIGLEATLIRVSGADHGFRQVTSRPISPSLKEIEHEVLVFFIKHLLRIR